MKIFRLCIALLATCTLIACGGTTTQTNSPTLVQTVDVVENNAELETQSKIAQIISEFDLTQDKTEAIWSLLNYAQEQQRAGKCNETELVVWHIIDQIELSPQLLEAEILRSECLILSFFQTGEYDNTELSRVDSWLANARDLGATDILPNKRVSIAAEALSVLQNPIQSNFFEILSMQENDSVLSAIRGELIWKSVTAKSSQQRAEFALQEPRISDYLAMYEIIADSALDDRERQAQLNTWISANADDEFLEKIPQEVFTFLQTPLNNSNKIAVLLPFSGRLSAQSEAIKQGILEAYFSLANANQTSIAELPEIEFIDTGSNAILEPSVNNINFLEYSHVIGPLLPSHIKALENIIKPGTNTLFLNTSELSEFHLGASFFSLSPEQEAMQIANKMMRSNVKNPVLIYAPGNRAKRMRDTFLEAWTIENGKAPADVSFSDNKSMRVGITSALGVLQSEQRIKQISNLTTEQIHSVTRNRRDVDAFVVFASAQQVELINPIIESSISLFGNVELPVYASSFSYSHKQNRNSLRDLRNMVFLDMPFVQPAGRNSRLATQVDDVFQQPSTSFLRLFAFGHDAFMLVKNNVQMNVFSNISREGLTGTLSINNNEIQRDLDVLAINSPRVGGSSE